MRITITLDINNELPLIELQAALEPWLSRDDIDDFIVLPTWDIDRDTIELVISKAKGREK
jgi:hypothetical protein